MLKKFHDKDIDLYGYKNEKGETIIPAVHESAEEFYYGFAEVGDGTRYGLINEAGKLVIPYAYDPLFLVSPTWIQAQRANLFMLFARSGELILMRDDLLAWNFPEDGMIRIKTESGWGTIDMAGKTVINPNYRSLGPMKNGWLSFYAGNHWGWLDTLGNIRMPAIFDQVGYWNNEFWWGLKEGKYQLYNFQCELVVDEGWLRIVPPGRRGAAVKTQLGWQFITENFIALRQFPPQYDWVEFFSDGLAAVKKAQKWGFINEALEEVIPAIYERVQGFSEGLAAVQKDKDWGYIDQSGEVVIPFRFHSAGNFKDGKAVVDAPYIRYYIDRQGAAASEIEILD